jgi:hypothetical protein
VAVLQTLSLNALDGLGTNTTDIGGFGIRAATLVWHELRYGPVVSV